MRGLQNRLTAFAAVAVTAGGAWAGTWITGSYDLAGEFVQGRGLTDDPYLSTGPFYLSRDASLHSVQVNTDGLVFDFARDGNHTLTLTRANDQVFAVMNPNLHTFFKGGTWTTSQNVTFTVCRRTVLSAAPADCSRHALTLSDGCVIDCLKGAGFQIGGGTSGSTLAVTDRSKVLATDFRLSAWGTVNSLRVLSGGEVSAETLHYDWNHGSSGGDPDGTMRTNAVEVAGEGSMLRTAGDFDMDRPMGGRLTIRDGGTLSVGGDLSLSRWGRASLVAGDGATVFAARALRLYGDSAVTLSNSSFSVGSDGVLARGNGNAVELLDPVEKAVLKVKFNDGGSSPAGCRLTAAGVNAQPVFADWCFGNASSGCVFELKDWASCASTSPDWLQLMVNATNCVFRLSGNARFVNVTNGRKMTTVGSNWGCSCTGNAIEVLDGSEFRTGDFRMTGFGNRLVVSNATFAVTGKDPVIVGYKNPGSADAIVLRGETPKVEIPLLQLMNSSVLRFEVPRNGYPRGHVPVSLGDRLVPESPSRLEIDCAGWRAGELEVVLLRQASEPSEELRALVADAGKSLPRGYALRVAGNDIVLERPVRGFAVMLKGGPAGVSELFGYDPEDSTRFLQAALDSGLPEIVIDAGRGPWHTLPLNVRSNQRIVFERGALLMAKRGGFHGLNDRLLTIADAENVSIRGYGATLRMWREDYATGEGYSRGEWRHTLAVMSSRNVLVEGLTLEDSGGDGIYVSTSTLNPNVDCDGVTIRDCVCDRHHRQAMSVISARNLLVENCVFRNTAGTPPEAGLDMEPNNARESFVNCVFRNCVSEKNVGSGFEVVALPSRRSTEPFSISFENCRAVGNERGFRYHNPIRDDTDYPTGLVSVVGCSLERSRMAAVEVIRKPATSVELVFRDCRFIDNVTGEVPFPDIALDSGYLKAAVTDGVVLDGVHVRQTDERPWITHADGRWQVPGVTRLDGYVIVDSPAGREGIALGADWCRRTFGTYDPAVPSGYRPFSPQGVTVRDVESGVRKSVSDVVIRYGGEYVFYAERGRRVRLEGRRVFYGTARPSVEWRVSAFGGTVLARGAMPDDAATEISCDVPEAGFYVLTIPDSYAFALTASDVPVALVVPEEGRAFIKATGTVYFHTHAADGFLLAACGADSVERVSASLRNPSGNVVWSDGEIYSWTGYVGEGGAEGLWSLTLGKPEKGRHEDFHVILRGVPGLFFLSPDRYWTKP